MELSGNVRGRGLHLGAWTIDEDMVLCNRILESDLVICDLTEAHVRSMFDVAPLGLGHRSMDALLERFRFLREGLLFSLAVQQRDGKETPSWEWLDELHVDDLQDFTYEEDEALCRLVLNFNAVGAALTEEWFLQHAVGRVETLSSRSAAQMAQHWRRRLQRRMSKAVLFSPTGSTDFRWLRQMHGQFDKLPHQRDSLQMMRALEGARGVRLGLLPFGMMIGEDSAARKERRIKRPVKDTDTGRRPRKSRGVEFSGQGSSGSTKHRKARTVVMNLDEYTSVQFSVLHEEPLLTQITPALLKQFGALTDLECAILCDAVLLALQSMGREKELAVAIVVDVDALQMLCSVDRAGRTVYWQLLVALQKGESLDYVLNVARSFVEEDEETTQRFYSGINWLPPFDKDGNIERSPLALRLSDKSKSGLPFDVIVDPRKRNEGPEIKLASMTLLRVRAWFENEVLTMAKVVRRQNFSFEEDVALCEMVMSAGRVGEVLPVSFFEERRPAYAALSDRADVRCAERYNEFLLKDLEQVLREAAEKRGEKSLVEVSLDPSFVMDYHWLHIIRDPCKAPFTYEEDYAICRAVLERDGLFAKVTEKWFREQVVGKYKVLERRSPKSLFQQFVHQLHTPLVEAIQAVRGRMNHVDFAWLREKHRGRDDALQRPFTFLEDLALAIRVIDTGHAGRNIPLEWFEKNLPYMRELSSRSLSALEIHYRNNLKTRVGRGYRTSQSTGRSFSWTWLYRFHNMTTVDRESILHVSGIERHMREVLASAPARKESLAKGNSVAAAGSGDPELMMRRPEQRTGGVLMDDDDLGIDAENDYNELMDEDLGLDFGELDQQWRDWEGSLNTTTGK